MGAFSILTTIQNNGSSVGTEPAVNLIQGSNMTLTVADNPGSGRVDVTIAENAGGYTRIIVAASNAPTAEKNRSDYVCTGTNDDVTILTAISALPTNGGVVELTVGTFTIGSAIAFDAANVTLQGQGIDATLITTTTTTIDGIRVGNTQSGGHVQRNNVRLVGMTVNLPTASTNTCVNVTGMGEGGQIINVKTGQGKYGFILEDIDRCIFDNIEAFNYNTAGIVCRQGYNNTWGTVTFRNGAIVANTASTIGVQFDADPAQLSPNRFDRVTFDNFHFYCNPGLAGLVAVKYIVGTYATTYLNCLWENPIQHFVINDEADMSLIGCSFLNNNYGTTPTTDTFYINSYAQISVYDCKFQQSQNVFNGVSGSPRVYLGGLNKSGGNITNIFTGSFGAKHGTDTDFAGDTLLAAGINAQRYGYVFVQNVSGVSVIQPNADSTTAIQVQNAGGSATVLTYDTTNKRIYAGGSTAPTATLHLAAGVATAGGAPIKLTSGTNLTTPEDGAVEYSGTHVYMTIGSTRYQLDQQSSAVGIRKVTSSFTFSSSDGTVEADTTSAAITGTLPPAASSSGQICSLAIVAGTHSATIAAHSGDLIAGSASWTFNTIGSSLSAQSDGTGWALLY